MTEPAYRLDLPETEAWPRQGEWTYEDYLRLPDDGNRYEVIRGALYVTPAPKLKHQFSVSEFSLRLGWFARENGLGRVLWAPLDVKLPAGIASPVQPDVVFFRTENEPIWELGYFEGVPDLILEVLSPRTRSRDRKVKLQAYQDAGVPEYWMADPSSREVVVHVLQNGRYVEHCRGGVGERVRSAVLPGFEVEVAGLFPRRRE
ncbi:MAG TPA: Uma2 family endonuclease [Thermoanaerobaculia bacterium]|jgi:Uma2 family endonuclease